MKCAKFNVVSATSEYAKFVSEIYNENIEALHGGDIYNWNEIFLRDKTDEKNFIICENDLPVAWLRIDGVNSKDIAWISMLIVEMKSQGCGVGIYAVNFAEEYIKSKGFNRIGVRTTEDNVAAQALYKKCGYAITEYGDCTTADGASRKGYTFEKEL